jgi:glyoxylase-like metal-dependent hydrolase (beta-lactamase superfamily II)
MSSLQYPIAHLPEPGTTLEVAPGVRWLRMPLPFQLNHINLWLLEDDGGWTIVDTGIGNEETRGLWEKIFSSLPDAKIRRILLTHYHPDHAGNAAWLCERFGVELWTTQGEYLTAHAVRAAGAGYTSEAVLAVFEKNGLDAERRAAMTPRGNRYAALVPGFPASYRRIYEGDAVRVGGRDWTAIVGYGHAPEHLSLHCRKLNVLIAGDMLLSTISTNVSVWSVDPEGDPLRLFLQSIARYRELPADVLVLPSHGKPFRGAHARVRELESHHAERFGELEAVLAAKPVSAAELLQVLFRRPLDAHQTFFAMGEAIAHLHYLYYAGRATRAVGADGVMRYARA